MSPSSPISGRATAGGVVARAKAALGAALARERPRAALDKQGYVVELEDNLLSVVTRAEIAEAFGAGAGQELEGKMRAPWSSSALAVNSFAPWARAPSSLRLSGLSEFTEGFAFEAKCPNGVSKIPPHLDVLLERDREIVAVESKCTEYLASKPAKVASAYLELADRGDERTSSRWFAALTQMEQFRRLDAYQLVKHYLGLRLSYPRRPLTLVYLYWEPANAARFHVFAQHRAEIERFGAMVMGDNTCRFAALSYPEHWCELATHADGPAWLDQHLAELERRYQVTI